MSQYRQHLPFNRGRPFLTDGGLETTLVFHDGIDLPCFAAFDLLKDEAGFSRLARYYDEYAAFPLGQLSFANEGEQFQQIGGELGVRVFPVEGLDIYANYAIHETSHFGGPRGNLTNDQRTSAHMFNAGVQYRAPFGLDLSVDFSYQSDQNWVEQVLDTERGGLSFVPFLTPAYAVLNARVGYRFFNDQLELAIAGTNLLADGQRQHPFGQPIDRRVMGSMTFRW